MAVAHSIFTLDGGGGSIALGSFWYAHDHGTIKSFISIGKIWFLGISKNNHDDTLEIIFCLNAQKLIFANPKPTFNGTTATIGSKAAKTIEPHI